MSPARAAPLPAHPATVDRLHSVEYGTSAETVAKMLRVLFPDAGAVLDATWGTGRFWTAGATLPVVGLDKSPHGRPAVVGDFTALPFADSAFDVVIYDPPYVSDTSKTGTSRVDRRFGSYRSEAEAKTTVQAGAAEAWRVGRLGVLLKIQDHIHASRYVDMTAWAREAIPAPIYGRVEQARQAPKILGSNWGDQLSVYSNSATFLAFRHGSQRHVRRGLPRLPAAPVAGGRGREGR